MERVPLFRNQSACAFAFNRQSVRGKQTDNDFALFAWRTRVLRIASKERLKNKFDAADITDALVRALASFSRVKDGPRFAVEELEKNGIAVVINLICRGRTWTVQR